MSLLFLEDNMKDENTIDKLMESMKRFKAIGDCYKQRENLKSWGWFWNPQRKHWEIEALNQDQPEINSLRKYGLLWEEIK